MEKKRQIKIGDKIRVGCNKIFYNKKGTDWIGYDPDMDKWKNEIMKFRGYRGKSDRFCVYENDFVWAISDIKNEEKIIKELEIGEFKI